MLILIISIHRYVIELCPKYVRIMFVMKQSNAPVLLLIAGLPGTGKSTVAKAFAERCGGVHISSDLLRKAMGLRGHYGPEDKEKVYQSMLDSARAALSEGQNAIVDSTFYRADVRAPFEALARSCGVPFFWVEMRAGENSIRERVESPRPDSEADFEVYLALRDQNEPMDAPHLVLWSDQMTLDDQVGNILNYTLQTSL
jgi:predicted kinase